MIVLIDTEFTSLHKPQLLSLGMVTADGEKAFYVELDLASHEGRKRRAAASAFTAEVVLAQWGLVEGAGCAVQEMGRRAAQWLLECGAETAVKLLVCYDYEMDFVLLQQLICDAGVWLGLRETLTPLNVSALTCTPDGEQAAQACFERMRARGLNRHHALADAHALSAAYCAATAGQGRGR